MGNAVTVCEKSNERAAPMYALSSRDHGHEDIERRLGDAAFAHDFNNFLSGILGSLEILKARLTEGRIHELGRHIETANRCAMRAAALTGRLLAGAEVETNTPTDLRQSIGLVVENLRTTVPASIEVEVVGQPGLWEPVVDPIEFENVLLNVCVNAIDAMPDGGRLSIIAQNAALTLGTAPAIGLRPGDYVLLTVEDTGTGMSPDVACRSFDALFTTKAPGHGTGLGLWRARQFVEKTGGQIGIQSVPGNGTSVFIYLPCRVRHTDGAWATRTPDL